MYAVQVMLGGDVFVVRLSDKVRARYKPDGTPVYGSKNALGLEPHNVLQLASEAERNWLEKYIHESK